MTALVDLLARGALAVEFRTIVEARGEQRRQFARECRVAGSTGTGVETPEALLRFARRHHAQLPLDRARLDAAFEAARGQDAPITIALHGVTLGRDHEFVVAFGDAATRWGIDPGNVILEILDVPSRWYAGTFRTNVEGLKAIGVRVAFGFSSGGCGFGDVLDHKPHFLKLDRSIVQGLHADPLRQAFVAATRSLGHMVGARTIAQGVEHERDLEVLRYLGVDFVEGTALAPGSS